MPYPAIKVECLWKEYIVGSAQQRHNTFYDMLASAVQTPLKRLRRLGGEAPEAERFWALRDINFEVQPGEVVGIIGRNGAGKSTLLKVLSRITAPTRGRVEVRGRLASLLEVGTGFHPELTGRENIYLNGAILGMSRGEIARKFDEIVAFAEVEKFIDTPVKRYSSGMYVRLAFAVAAHLDSDVMLVDEVLAVGDAQFQKRCLAKMEHIAGGGKTVILVSHNLGSIQSLCKDALLFEAGRLAQLGDTHNVLDTYLSGLSDAQSLAVRKLHHRFTAALENVDIEYIRIEDGKGQETRSVAMGNDIAVFIGVRSPRTITRCVVSLGIKSDLGNVALIAGSFANDDFHLRPGESVIKGSLANMSLTPGYYSVNVDISAPAGYSICRIEDAAGFRVSEPAPWSTGWRPPHGRRAWVTESSWEVLV